MKTKHLLAIGLSMGALACQTTEIDPSGDDVGINEGDAQRDGGRSPLICDAVYIPIVTFEVSANGALYCGNATVSYLVENRAGNRTLVVKECNCDPREEADAGYELVLPGLKGCVVDPDYGASTVTLEVPGYETVETSIDLPYECHPRVHIVADLEPI